MSDTSKAPVKVAKNPLFDLVAGATVTDGMYSATLSEIEVLNPEYQAEVTEITAGVKTTKMVTKIGQVFNIIWTLADGRRLVDPRFTRNTDKAGELPQSIRIALGNLATQKGKTGLTINELLAEKDKAVNVWVSHVRDAKTGKMNRNVDYLEPVKASVGVSISAIAGAGKPVF